MGIYMHAHYIRVHLHLIALISEDEITTTFDQNKGEERRGKGEGGKRERWRMVELVTMFLVGSKGSSSSSTCRLVEPRGVCSGRHEHILVYNSSSFLDDTARTDSSIPANT